MTDFDDPDGGERRDIGAAFDTFPLEHDVTITSRKCST